MERFDFGFAPFDALSSSEQARLQNAMQIVFFDDDEEIVGIGGDMDALYVVIKGLVKGVGADGETEALYHPQDSFDARALFEKHSPYRFVAVEQSLLYAIPRKTVMALVEANINFGAYFYSSVADKLANLSGNARNQELANLFHAKVFDAYHDNTIWLDGTETLAQSAQIMKRAKSKSLLVRQEDKVGLLTESVFRDIVAQGIDVNSPVMAWTNFNLISIDVDDYVFNALLKMMHHRIQRLVVMQGGRAVGTLEQIDILAYLSSHSHLIAEQLERADSLDALAKVANQLTESVSTPHASGMQAVQLARLMQVLNGRLFEKAWQLIAPPELIEKTCLIVMGSEGRGEQVLKTDQDNALIAQDDVDMTALQTYASQFSEALIKFGYPPCKGNVMVTNPKWCKTASEFGQMVTSWRRNPTPENLMDLAIFVDAKAVAGDERLLMDIKENLKKHAFSDTGMLMAFARAVTQFDDHSRGFFAKVLGKNDKNIMDIKKMGVFPVVHGTRALSLKAGIFETSTFERLDALQYKGVISPQLAKDTKEALAYLMNLRLKTGLTAYKNGEEYVPNQVDTHNLSTLERDLLKDALAVVRRFKHDVSLQFGLTNG